MTAELFLHVALLLLSAKLFGEVAERLGAASLVGQLVAGIVVGPVLGLVVIRQFLTDFVTLGIVFLLFMAGLEIKFSEIKKYVYSASILAFTGGFLSFLFGFFVGMTFFNDAIIGFAIGTALISTSNGTLFLFLMKTGEFTSKTGRMIIAITIADDVVGMLFLSLFSAYIKSNTVAFSSTLQLVMLSLGIYLVLLTAGSKILDFLVNAVSRFMDREILLAVPAAATFFLAYVTENLGLSFAVGAFLAGMAIANNQFNEPVISPKVRTAAEGFFIPVFYATIGASLVFTGMDPLLIAAIVAAAILGKVIGVGVLSRFFGVRGNSQRLLGLIMIPRGNENIAIVQIILLLGVISFQIYTSIVFAMIATVLLTPIFLKVFYRK
jgi:Kef-type K+ transport system membrane component KefB